ncbi:DUF2274 domain-containing protein [Agrobacterium deltaense]|uniref:DUF2274 domain-containing protein n=1 Tax=Agrobacterium deltaense TaxID=1183412 RepID=UPI001C6DE0BF|nr:DUF2274 domain-containing protein [Agrobacterium deltaense]MBW9075703.1 DUF2274 domain-containing protein [Agrobacterium deltaense]
MTKLKLSAIPDDKPVKITVELPAEVFKDLQTYASILAQTTGGAIPPEPSKLIAPMLHSSKFLRRLPSDCSPRILKIAQPPSDRKPNL